MFTPHAGAHEWEAVDTTLFPHSLLPLVKFLLSSLVRPFVNPSSSSSQATPTEHSAGVQLEGSELARQVVWACMVDDPRLFFRPLLNRFNKLYMIVSDKKQKKSNIEFLIVSCLR